MAQVLVHYRKICSRQIENLEFSTMMHSALAEQSSQVRMRFVGKGMNMTTVESLMTAIVKAFRNQGTAPLAEVLEAVLSKPWKKNIKWAENTGVMLYLFTKEPTLTDNDEAASIGYEHHRFYILDKKSGVRKTTKNVADAVQALKEIFDK